MSCHKWNVSKDNRNISSEPYISTCFSLLKSSRQRWLVRCVATAVMHEVLAAISAIGENGSKGRFVTDLHAFYFKRKLFLFVQQTSEHVMRCRRNEMTKLEFAKVKYHENKTENTKTQKSLVFRIYNLSRSSIWSSPRASTDIRISNICGDHYFLYNAHKCIFQNLGPTSYKIFSCSALIAH